MSTPRQSILSILAIYGPQTTQQMAAALGWTERRVWHHLNKARWDCLIKRMDKHPDNRLVFGLVQIRGYRR